jgi:hypothetical protein
MPKEVTAVATRWGDLCGRGWEPAGYSAARAAAGPTLLPGPQVAVTVGPGRARNGAAAAFDDPNWR